MTQTAQVEEDVRRALARPELRTGFRLSPDGGTVAWFEQHDHGQELHLQSLNEVGAVQQQQSSCVRLPSGHASDLVWMVDSGSLVMRHSASGRESWELQRFHVGKGAFEPVSDGSGIIEFWVPRCGASVVYSQRHGAGSILLCFDPVDGTTKELARSAAVRRWFVDERGTPFGGVSAPGPDGCVLYACDGDGELRPLHRVSLSAMPDLAVIGMGRSRGTVWILSSDRTATRALCRLDLRDGEISVDFADPRCDIGGYPVGDPVLLDPQTGEPDLVAVMEQRLTYHPLSDRARERARHLIVSDRAADIVVDRSADDSLWLLGTVHDDAPMEYSVLDTRTGDRRTVTWNRPDLVDRRLAKTRDLVTRARDGLELPGYITRPAGASGPLPTVVAVHGGPASRDLWRFHAEAQAFATMGWQTITVNYRGSRGFGARHRALGTGEWGGRMQDDLYDALDHAADLGLVDVTRVVFYGHSYGGYAATMAAIQRPDVVRAAVAVNAPLDICELVTSPPPYWRPLAGLIRRGVLGDNAATGPPHGKCPVHALTGSAAPITLFQGALDPRTDSAAAARFVARAHEVGADVTLRVLEREGHRLRRADSTAALHDAVIQVLLKEGDADVPA